ELYGWNDAASASACQRARRSPNQTLFRIRDCDVIRTLLTDASFVVDLLVCTMFGTVHHATITMNVHANANNECALHIGERVPNLQRTTRVFCELTSATPARNFAALQSGATRIDRDQLIAAASSEFAEQFATQFRDLQTTSDSYDLVLLLHRSVEPSDEMVVR